MRYLLLLLCLGCLTPEQHVPAIAVSASDIRLVSVAPVDAGPEDRRASLPMANVLLPELPSVMFLVFGPGQIEEGSVTKMYGCGLVLCERKRRKCACTETNSVMTRTGDVVLWDSRWVEN